MPGASKPQVNAEEMLAELKRALESSTPPPDVPRPSTSTSTVSNAISADRQNRGPQIDGPRDRPFDAKADKAIRQPSDLPGLTKGNSRSWKRIAGGLALAGAATLGVSFVLMDRTPIPPKVEPSIVVTQAPVRPQNEPTPEPSSDAGSPMRDGRPQVGAVQPRPDVRTAPANGTLLPAEADAPRLGSLGLESAAPAFTPAPPDPTPTSQPAKPDGAPIATAPSTPASTDSAPPAGTPKPNATPEPHMSKETARPSTPRIDPTKPAAKAAPKTPVKSAKVSEKPVNPAGRQTIPPARPKAAESPPQLAQDAGSPIQLAPASGPSPTIQQRFADGVTHAFSYVTRLPGALIPH